MRKESDIYHIIFTYTTFNTHAVVPLSTVSDIDGGLRKLTLITAAINFRPSTLLADYPGISVFSNNPHALGNFMYNGDSKLLSYSEFLFLPFSTAVGAASKSNQAYEYAFIIPHSMTSIEFWLGLPYPFAGLQTIQLNPVDNNIRFDLVFSIENVSSDVKVSKQINDSIKIFALDNNNFPQKHKKKADAEQPKTTYEKLKQSYPTPYIS
jgi:hypothetical protein